MAFLLCLPGCGTPPTEPNTWVWTYDGQGLQAVGVGTFVPPDPVTRGQAGSYGMVVQVTTNHTTIGLDIWAQMWDQRQLWSAPSASSGDFILGWSSFTQSQCKAYKGWQTGTVNIGSHGACYLTSEGTLTPTLCPQCTSSTCVSNGTFRIFMGLTTDYGTQQGGPYTVSVTP